MNSIVSITLSGNLTKDATFKAYEDKGVINFSFAVNEPGKDKMMEPIHKNYLL